MFFWAIKSQDTSEQDGGFSPTHGKTLGISKGEHFSICDRHVPLYLHLWSLQLFHRVLSVFLWSRKITKFNEGQSLHCLQLKSWTTFNRTFPERKKKKIFSFLLLMLMFQLPSFLLMWQWTDTNSDGGSSCGDDTGPLCHWWMFSASCSQLAGILDSKKVQLSSAAPVSSLN